LPVNYQELGGAGKNYATHDLINVHLEALFDGLGMPRELFRGSMNVEQTPGALRMFERSYEWMYQAMNGMVDFITRTVLRFMDVPEMKVRLKRPAMAYNAEWMQIKLQMAANREIPRTDVYGDMGVSDPADAAARAVMEDQEIQRRTNELAIKFEKEKTQGSMADIAMAAAEQAVPQQGGGASGAATPGQGGLDYAVDSGADPLQIQQRAQDIASQWLQMHSQQPNSHRKEMQRCEAINPTLYAAAKQEMEQMRSQAESQGRQSAGQPVQ
jgi:hypothetical protein